MRELFGMPCSGKSFTLNQRNLPIYPMDTEESYRKLGNCLWMLIRHPHLTFVSLKSVMFIERGFFLIQMIAVIRLLSRYSSYARLKNRDIYLEEGMLQSFWGLICLFKQTTSAEEYAKNLYESYISSVIGDVVYVSCQRRVAIARNVNRGKQTRLTKFLINENDSLKLRGWMAFVLRTTRQDRKVKVWRN